MDKANHLDGGWDSAARPTDRDILQAFLDGGIGHLVTVPCSITATWLALAERAASSGDLQLVRTNHEGNLAGIAAGIWFGAGRPALVHTQNSGLTNAADGFISFAGPDVYGIPMAVMVTWRGAEVHDVSAPHQAIGCRTADLCRAVFERESLFGGPDGADVLDEVNRVIDVVDHGGMGVLRLPASGFRKTFTVAPPPPSAATAEDMAALSRLKGHESLPPALAGPERIPRDEAIAAIAAHHPAAAILFSNGYTARAAQAVADRPGNFYNAGYMGGTLAIGWGLARTRPALDVVVVDGDQNAMMTCMKDNLLADYPPNLHWYILDNRIGASAGGAVSLPLSPVYGHMARVVATVPDGPEDFPYPHVQTVGVYAAEAKFQESGTLTGLARGFRRWLAQQLGA